MVAAESLYPEWASMQIFYQWFSEAPQGPKFTYFLQGVECCEFESSYTCCAPGQRCADSFCEWLDLRLYWGRGGGGQVVGVLLPVNSDNPSSKPAEVSTIIALKNVKKERK